MLLQKAFNRARDYFADCKEYRQQVDRQHSMIHGGHIVLSQDFQACFKLMRENGKKSSYCERMFRDFEYVKHLIRKTATLEVPSFSIPLNCLAEKARKEALASYEGSKETNRFLQQRLGRSWTGNQLDLLVPSAEPPTHQPGFYLWDLLETADEAGIDLDGCDRREIWTGHGASAVAFWKSINALDDYSHHFPDRRLPRNGHKNKKKQAAPTPTWQPVPVNVPGR